MKKENKIGDVNLWSDLISLLEELTNLEKHAINNISHNEEINKERAKRWKEIATDIRNLRHKWLGLLVNDKYNYEELFCFSKHLLTASKNFIEVGNKLEDTPEYSNQAFQDRAKLLDYLIEMNELGENE